MRARTGGRSRVRRVGLGVWLIALGVPLALGVPRGGVAGEARAEIPLLVPLQQHRPIQHGNGNEADESRRREPGTQPVVDPFGASAGVPAPGPREHDLWAPAMDVLQLKKFLEEVGGGRLPQELSLEQQWQQLLLEQFLRQGILSPEEQKRYLEMLQRDREQWERLLAGIRQRLIEEGRVGPPLPPPSWRPILPPITPERPPGVSPDVPPGVSPPPDHSPVRPLPDFPPPPLDTSQPMPGHPDPRHRSWEAFQELWERSIGPLDQTPQLRELLLYMVERGGMKWDLKDASGRSFWEVLRERLPESQNGPGGAATDSNGGEAPQERRWRWPRWQWPRGSWSWPWRKSHHDGSRSLFGGFSTGGWDWLNLNRPSYLMLALLAILLPLVVALILWHRRLRTAAADGPSSLRTIRDLAPVDPQQIRTAADVVHAFEWWSVQLLGPAARSWTHATIVQALHRKAVVQKEQAEELAQLYELARYAPEATELPPQVWNRARHILCQWAGISPV
jgi:hypothetical protein